ncbi:MAG TPA: NAD(P)-binding domain-containing protein [Mycobacterium sp.]|nr:NAD(P)-binding domain-containing protein [Mycobacterium sp.]
MVPVAIVGAGPYGMSVAAHLSARNIEHRIVGRPMQFWSQIAAAGGERYLKSFCFGTDISSPNPGFSFADYNRPRGLETFEPCSMENFASYGLWFQEKNLPWVEPVDVVHVEQMPNGFAVSLSNGESFGATHLVLATGLSRFANIPGVLSELEPGLAMHTSDIKAFSAFSGRSVAVLGAGQSALEGAALLHEAGAHPQLLVREDTILWQTRIPEHRSPWRRLRSPISGLGAGPKAWALTNIPGGMHRMPEGWRSDFVRTHLPAEGAWWLRSRVEGRVPIHRGTKVVGAKEVDGGVALQLATRDGTDREIVVDHVVAGSGYIVDVDRIDFLDPMLRAAIERIGTAPRLNAVFETSVPRLHIVGPASAQSFGPLFRFVVGAKYTSRVVSTHVSSRVAA